MGWGWGRGGGVDTKVAAASSPPLPSLIPSSFSNVKHGETWASFEQSVVLNSTEQASKGCPFPVCPSWGRQSHPQPSVGHEPLRTLLPTPWMCLGCRGREGDPHRGWPRGGALPWDSGTGLRHLQRAPSRSWSRQHSRSSPRFTFPSPTFWLGATLKNSIGHQNRANLGRGNFHLPLGSGPALQ